MKNHLIKCVLVALFITGISLSAVTVEQVISHENKAFNLYRSASMLRVGFDGLVYVGNANYVMRVERDGSNRIGAPISYAMSAIAANKDSVFAVSSGHFTCRVTLFDKNLVEYAFNNDFLVSDNVGWNAPGTMAAGESGDFYGLDQHRNRILRINAANKVVAIYPYLAEGEDPMLNYVMYEFRVSEQTETFYHRHAGTVRAVGFDGKTKFIYNANLSGNHANLNGAFTVSPEGILYVISADSSVVTGVDQNGNAFGQVQLISDGVDDKSFIDSLDVNGDDIFIKRNNQIYLFERYDMDGKFKNRVGIDHEKLSVTFDSEKWIQGTNIDFKIDFQSLEGRLGVPNWKLWMRPYDSSDYIEVPVENGKIHVPDNISAGLYFWKVSPEVQPIQTGIDSQYLVFGVVEILPDNNSGTINVVTPDNRTNYGRGEAILGTIIVKSEKKPTSVVLQLVDDNNEIVAKTGNLTIPADSDRVNFLVEKNLTDYLSVGNYKLVAVADGFTSVPQNIYIGKGVSAYDQKFTRISFGDYGPLYVTTNKWWNSAELTRARGDFYARLNVNMVTDRMATTPQQHAIFDIGHENRALVTEIKNRLNGDFNGIAAEKVDLSTSLLQTMARYSAQGIGELVILTNMDAGLPLGGAGFDHRTVEQYQTDVERIHNVIKQYGAFQGWVWSTNWWVYDDYKEHPEWRDKYAAARKDALDNGKWDPIIDEAYSFWIRHAYNAQKILNDKLAEIEKDNKYITASAGSVRNIKSYPPVSLANIKEIDLFAQWEQMGPPFNGMFNVDYYSRPGKRSWAHPEIWNDSGTGDQALPTIFAHVMRGVDGIGQSGVGPNWGPVTEDNRLASQGLFSVHRAANNTTKEYGPWLTTLTKNDKIALVVSRRMCAIDDYHHSMGKYFARLLEAHASLIHSQHPASIVYMEDLPNANALSAYKAVIVVSQLVPLDPPLATALNNAKNRGTTVFYDKSCRAEFVQGFTPLDVAFNKYENATCVGTDAAYFECLEYVLENVKQIKPTLDALVNPDVEVKNPEIYSTEFVNGDGKYVMLVNNTTPFFDPGQLWKAALVVTSRLPVIEEIKLPAGRAYYDVFALKQVTPVDGKLNADFRNIPARIYAVLPAEIGSVQLIGPGARVNSGSPIGIGVRVNSTQNQPINASIPIKITLKDADSIVLEEIFASADGRGFSGGINIPYNIEGELTLTATELFSGKESVLKFTVVKSAQPNIAPTVKALVRPTTNGTANIEAKNITQESQYGVHAKDVVITNDGNSAIINLMNWDSNLVSIDVATGELKWAKRVGHHFTFDPQVLSGDTFAVQGFDMESAEGYHLYLGNSNGDFSRRFALYGISRRTPHRFVPYILNDNMNKFAVAKDGAWVAASGDLGVAAWSRDGQILYNREDWEENRSFARLKGVAGWNSAPLTVPYIVSADDRSLLIADGMNLTLVDVYNGNTLWQTTLASEGQVTKAKVADNGNIVLFTTSSGGRMFILNSDGKVVDHIPTAGDNFDMTKDGQKIVIVDNNVLKYYELNKGLIWSFSADSYLRMPKINAAGTQVVANSEMGTLYVLSDYGLPLFEKDMGSIPVSAFLPNGNLFVSTWMGKVVLFDAGFNAVYEKQIDTKTPQMTAQNMLYKDTTTTNRMSSWGNASPNIPESPNLLSQVAPRLSFMDGQRGNAIEFDGDSSKIFDNDLTPPEKPLLKWDKISWYGEGSAHNWLEFDFFNKALNVTGVAFYEDPAHPESWMRDVYFEVWNGETASWDFVESFLSDSAIHYHELKTPVFGGRFRIVLQPGVVGNIRLAEVKFFGEVAGSSNPYVQAKKDTAILFDEQIENLKAAFTIEGATFDYSDAASGTTSIVFKGDHDGAPLWYWPFGHVIRDWNFDIVANPAPGQYRYLEFSVKASSEKTRGITVGFPSLGGLAFVFGERTENTGGYPIKVTDTVPTEWVTVRYDLYATLGNREGRIYDLRVGTKGDGAKIDNIILRRTLD